MFLLQGDRGYCIHSLNDTYWHFGVNHIKCRIME